MSAEENNVDEIKDKSAAPGDGLPQGPGHEEEAVKRKVEELRILKNQQTASLTAVTKKRNEISRLMTDLDNLHLVKAGLEDFSELCAQYHGCYEAHHSALVSEGDRENESKRLEEKEISILGFTTQVQGWVQQSEKHLSDQFDGKSGISRSTSHSSRSSTRSALLQEKARLAGLIAKRAMAEKQAAIAKQQAELKAQGEMVKLETEIEMCRAREQVFADEESISNTVLPGDISVSKQPLDPTAKPFKHVPDQPVQTQSMQTPPVQSQPTMLTSNHNAHMADGSVTVQQSQSDLILQAHQQLATAMILPHAEVPKFRGDPIEYAIFIMAFAARIVPHTRNDSDRLYYLDQHLEGEAKTLIGACLFMNATDGYREAKESLKREYGDPYKVSAAYVNKVLAWSSIKVDDSYSLKQFSLFLVKCSQAMNTMSHLQVLNHVPNMQAIVNKLPVYLQNKWRDHAMSIRMKNVELVFSDLVKFLRHAAEAANDPVFSKEALSKCDLQKSGSCQSVKPTQIQQKWKSSSFATAVQGESQDNTPDAEVKRQWLCHLCKMSHGLDDCPEFAKKSIDEKRDFLKEKRLCFGCYGYNHISKGCMKKLQCKTCGKRHPTALHVDNFQLSRNGEHQYSSGKPAGSSDSVTTSTCMTTDTVLQAILPVKVHVKGRNETVATYAFYDNGSTGCFITENIKDKLSPDCRDTVLKMQTMHGTNYVNTSAVYDLVVCDVNGNNAIELPKTYVKGEIPVSHNQIPKPEILKHWSHLDCVVSELPAYDPSLEIGVLIGSNCPAALQPMKVMPTDGVGPFAVLYKHGWTVNGPLHVSVDSNGVTCHRVVFTETEHVKECVTPDQINKFFALDFSEKDIGRIPDECGNSFEDESFLKMAENEISFVGGHYQIPLPFRNVNATDSLPNNRPQAVSRAEWQKKKMLKNMKYHSDYVSFIEKLIAKGHAHKATYLSADAPCWYLPHHGVYHPRKLDKIRVVFDCSAKYRGTSLNDQLIQGPDLTNSIIGVLTRFRQKKIAFMCDVEAMFYQVKVPETQQDFLRFLWWPGGDTSRPLEEYKMGVHIFGAASSPSVCNFALKKAADYAEVQYGMEVADTIRKNFYVDDCLKSCPDVSSTASLIKDLVDALADQGFHLAKFASNSKDVLKSIPQEECSKEVQACNLDYSMLTMERALGIQWHMEPDVFKFSVNLEEKPITRRGLLSTISSLYDPLGLVSPFVLPAKKILQDLCNEKELSWDDEIPSDYKCRWIKWASDLPKLENLSIPRCMMPEGYGVTKSCQLHIFSDASSIGYGVAAYIRLDDGSMVNTSLLMGKARLAPLKPTTIPRLELTAATVAVNIAQHILKELDMKVDSLNYYTDSTTVLHYIHSNAKRFPVFVANRVRVIRDFSEPSQWKYVHTSENPADVASRGADAQQLMNNTLWFNGPLSLRSLSAVVPEPPACQECDEESKETVSAVTVDTSCNSVHRLLEHYSSFYKLKKAVAIYRRLFDILKSKKTVSRQESFTCKELQDAEIAIVRFIQKEEFHEEVKSLMGQEGERGRVVKKNSSIHKLDPFMDRNTQLLRVGGRLSRADMPSDTKHQILLPRRGHVTTVIIRSVHEQLSHAGRNHVLSAVREKYWVVGGNAAVRSVITHCVICRKLREPVLEQKMADLPEDRVNPAPPFTHVGVDFFGPHLIKEGRKEVKRYGALFTCLVSRAVHIETANTLETASFIHALRRFISRRGPPQSIRCDNGTNFRGAERELREVVQEMDQKRIESYLLHENIQWKFNPPAASHMGGVWERMMRTARKVLAPMLKEFGPRIDDESYRTLLCEVECIVNSRPLTSITDSVDDLNPLTPSHLLTTKTNIITPPPGNFQKNDVYLRKRWRHVQYLANVFWSRWKREYLQTLQTRQKWTTPRRNLQVGDIVLVKDENLPRNMWNMGRVMDVDTDRKGVVRSAKIKTMLSELHRPIQKLVLLLSSEV